MTVTAAEVLALDAAAIRQAAEAYPKPSHFTPDYGTAGFRAHAGLLASTVFRCGLLMALRARGMGKARRALFSTCPRRGAQLQPAVHLNTECSASVRDAAPFTGLWHYDHGEPQPRGGQRGQAG
jgi:hypothetical protein